MFQHQGIWLPDGEKHFPEWMDKNGELVDGRGSYQIKKWRACLPWIKNWRTAVDVGAHVGFWSIQMAERFERVEAFEPMPQFLECWHSNVNSMARKNVACQWYALGAAPGRVSMNYNPADSGNTHVGAVSKSQLKRLADQEAHGDEVDMRTLDSFEFQNVDYIKIDAEGYEHHIVEGARETILRCKPCVIVEQKQHKMALNYPGQKGTPAVDMLREMGAHLRTVISGDYIMSFD